MVKIRREAFFHDVKIHMNPQWFEAATHFSSNLEMVMTILF